MFCLRFIYCFSQFSHWKATVIETMCYFEISPSLNHNSPAWKYFKGSYHATLCDSQLYILISRTGPRCLMSTICSNFRMFFNLKYSLLTPNCHIVPKWVQVGVITKVLPPRGWGKFCSHAKFEVGDGFKIRFWRDMIFGAGIRPLRKPFQFYLVLLA